MHLIPMQCSLRFVFLFVSCQLFSNTSKQHGDRQNWLIGRVRLIAFYLFVFSAMICLLEQPENETNEPNEKWLMWACKCICICVSVCLSACLPGRVRLICCIGDMDSIEKHKWWTFNSCIGSLTHVLQWICSNSSQTKSNWIEPNRIIPIHLDFINVCDRVYQHDPIS